MNKDKEPLMSFGQWITQTGNTLSIKAYAKYHTEWHLRQCSEVVDKNISLIETNSKELNSNDYRPFVTDYDNTIWTVDKQSITNAIENYIKENL